MPAQHKVSVVDEPVRHDPLTHIVWPSVNESVAVFISIRYFKKMIHCTSSPLSPIGDGGVSECVQVMSRTRSAHSTLILIDLLAMGGVIKQNSPDRN